ncbi:MAG: hypothetical protein AAB393_13025, partial [Bacteroidota bacterium]
IALDLFTGQTMWQNSHLRFLFATDDSVFASGNTVDDRLVHKLNYRTGEEIAVLPSDDELFRSAPTRALVTVDEKQIFPDPVDELEAGNGSMSNAIFRHCIRENVVGPIEAAEKDGLLFFCYHEKGGNGDKKTLSLLNVLKVADLERGNLVFAETLNTSVQAVVPDSFFISENLLYFIRERTMLTAVDISRLKEQR